MARTATDLRRVAFGAALAVLLLAPAGSLHSEPAPGARYLLSATQGGGATAPKVLLRWSAADRPRPYPDGGPYARYLVRRRAETAASLADLAVVEPLTDAADIDALFAGGGTPDPSTLREELTALLVPGVAPTLGEALLALRLSADPGRRMQYQMILAGNHRAAMAAGLAYLDDGLTDGTRYLYEVWGLDDLNVAVERLGKIWVKAGVDTVLPAPVALAVVEVADADNPPLGDFPGIGDLDLDGDGRIDGGAFGDGKIYLKWDPTPGQAKDRETQTSGFGFDVYRDLKPAGPCPATPPLPPGGAAVKVNTVPVLPLPATGDDPATPAPDPELPDFFFVDDNGNDLVPPTVRGTSYCYWLVARDLLRQPGAWSAPVVGCAPDRGRPRQVRDVRTEIVSPAQVQVSWTANASDPPTAVGGSPYVDDTVAYNVYRFTDRSRLLGPPLPVDRVATGLPAGTISWTDVTPASPSSNRGKLYWYTVTATDTGLCGRPANESAHSAPARAVVYDETPPAIAAIAPFCAPLTSSLNPRCYRDCGGTGLPPAIAAWCHAGGASGLFPRAGLDAWGFSVLPASLPSDNWTVRLYRAKGCSTGTDFRPVEEDDLAPGESEYLLPDNAFQPRVSQKIEYRLRALDRDSNLGASTTPRTFSNQPLPVYLRSAPPARPTIVQTIPAGGGNVKVRWHAPGSEGLAGFVVRVGPAADRLEGDFSHLPAGNLCAETSDTAPCIAEDADFDGVPSPYSIVIHDDRLGPGTATKCLAEFPNLPGFKVGEYFEHTVAAPARGEAIEVYAADITGQLSEPAIAPNATLVPDFTPPWPERDLPPTFDVLSAVVPAGGGMPLHVDLCWDQGAHGRCFDTQEICDEAADCPGSVCVTSLDPYPHVAVFRTRVEAGRPDSFQQRSPLLNIRLYTRSDCACIPGLVGAVSPVCWQDFSVATGTFKYSVQRFRGPPLAVDAERHSGEIHSAGTPAAPVVVP